MTDEETGTTWLYKMALDMSELLWDSDSRSVVEVTLIHRLQLIVYLDRDFIRKKIKDW